MSDDFSLSAQLRTDAGKGASRRLRRLQNLVPAVIYGSDKPPMSISLKMNEFQKALANEAFYSHIVSLTVDGNSEEVILKDLQRHPAKAVPMHADFYRVDKNKKLVVNVPLHFINEDTSKGVKVEGGLVSHLATEIEVSCLPGDLPEYIEVDMQDVGLGDIVHLTDITLPEGVESVALSYGEDHDQSVAAINAPKAAPIEEEEETAGEEGDEAADGESAADAEDGDDKDKKDKKED